MFVQPDLQLFGAVLEIHQKIVFGDVHHFAILMFGGSRLRSTANFQARARADSIF